VCVDAEVNIQVIHLEHDWTKLPACRMALFAVTYPDQFEPPEGRIYIYINMYTYHNICVYICVCLCVYRIIHICIYMCVFVCIYVHI